MSEKTALTPKTANNRFPDKSPHEQTLIADGIVEANYSLQQRISELEKEREQLFNLAEIRRIEINRSIIELGKQDSEIESLKKERDELKEELKTSDEYGEVVEAQNIAWGERLVKKDSEIEALKKDNERLKKELNIVHDCLTDLYNWPDNKVGNRVRKCVTEIELLRSK